MRRRERQRRHSLKCMLDENYIVGLVDGEGSFTVYVRNPNKRSVRKRRVSAEPKFYIKLVEKDKAILYELKKFFSCGNVYFQRDNRKNHQQCFRFEVGKREDLEKIIIPFFQKHPLRFPSKQKDFRLFSNLFFSIKNAEHLTEKGIQKLFRIKQYMH